MVQKPGRARCSGCRCSTLSAIAPGLAPMFSTRSRSRARTQSSSIPAHKSRTRLSPKSHQTQHQIRTNAHSSIRQQNPAGGRPMPGHGSRVRSPCPTQHPAANAGAKFRARCPVSRPRTQAFPQPSKCRHPNPGPGLSRKSYRQTPGLCPDISARACPDARSKTRPQIFFANMSVWTRSEPKASERGHRWRNTISRPVFAAIFATVLAPMLLINMSELLRKKYPPAKPQWLSWGYRVRT